MDSTSTKTQKEQVEFPVLVAKHIGHNVPQNQAQYNQVISARTAKSYVENWRNEVQNNADLTQLFWSVTGEQADYITGVSLNYEEILKIMSPVGTTEYKMFFGLNEEKQFKLITFGVDRDSEIVTPILALDNYTSNSFTQELEFKGGFVPNLVAPILAQEWISTWDNAQKIPAEFFMVYGQVLNGYTVPGRNLQNVMQTFQTKEANLNIALTLHGISQDKATAGTIMFTANRNGEAYAFNFCLPCPKTCGLGKGGSIFDGDWWSF